MTTAVRRATVFVPQQPTRYDHELKARVPSMNLNSASEYGDLKVLVPSGIAPIFYAPIVTAVKEQMRDMSPDDYVMAVGDPILMAIVAGIALTKHRRMNMLRWNRDARRYEPVEVSI